MTVAHSHRGGATIGHLQDFDAVATASIVYLRMWGERPAGQSRVHRDLMCTLGEQRGGHACDVFAELNSICERHARRPLMHYPVRCKCVGADEACFAHFIATAADGDAADALMFAMVLVRPDVAPVVAGLAAQFGLALKQMNLAALQPQTVVQTAPHTLH